MNGQVYRVSIRGQARNLPHPHVVLIELDKECWLIPAFGDDGPEIQALIRAYQIMGFDAADAAVHLDNGIHVTYEPGYSGIKAYWAVARAVRVMKSYLNNCQYIGQMNDTGMLKIAEATARLAKSKPDFISPSLQKKVRKLIVSLLAKTHDRTSAHGSASSGQSVSANPGD